MISINFVYIMLLSALVGVVLIASWMRARKNGTRYSKLYYTIPLIIIMGISSILIQETVWQVEYTQTLFQRSRTSILNRKWAEVIRQIEILQEENFKLSEDLSDKVIESLADYSAEELDHYLLTIGMPGNIIQRAVDDAIKGVYFRDLVLDTNDPMAMIIGKGEEDSFVFANFSQSYGLQEIVSSLEQEYHLFRNIVGGDLLAAHTLQRIVNLEEGRQVEDSLFLQVNKRPGGELEVFTLGELKDIFIKNRGDIEKTFCGIEFLAPYYIYRDEAISGTPRLENRVKTDAKVIGIISSFGYVDIIRNDKTFKASLEYFEELLDLNKDRYATEGQTTLIIGLLIMGLVYVLLILLWLFMHTAGGKNKLSD